ncbi:VacJ family lipoprotein, partial [Gammaproteobacteria bacterium]|nr:VacJ family lipoprotein [Gammaproteobacteria bacterium]
MYRILIVSFLSVSLIYAEDINDPFENINRITFKFNESIDNNFLKPVALTYSKAPKPIKKGISNFFDNLEEIETSVNQILQGKPKLAINDFSRFIINSTIGLGGFLDVATKIGLTRHEEEFDQTLALWGVPSGPYIMLPGLGPSTLRDTLARPFSSFLSVTLHMTESDVNLALKG